MLRLCVKGTGSGYVLTIGGKRIYLSGDTADIPEMRALTDVDVAFVCMNVPYTMDVVHAAGIIRSFHPKVIYPYHYQNQDGTFANMTTLRQSLGVDLSIELRLRAWY
jgi:L-ascorbate metabolism protein UlaG (beta-lactamase superfamily)